MLVNFLTLFLFQVGRKLESGRRLLLEKVLRLDVCIEAMN
jgi:hypothetical protein